MTAIQTVNRLTCSWRRLSTYAALSAYGVRSSSGVDLVDCMSSNEAKLATSDGARPTGQPFESVSFHLESLSPGSTSPGKKLVLVVVQVLVEVEPAIRAPDNTGLFRLDLYVSI